MKLKRLNKLKRQLLQLRRSSARAADVEALAIELPEKTQGQAKQGTDLGEYRV
jgi:hypothetical protein